MEQATSDLGQLFSGDKGACVQAVEALFREGAAPSGGAVKLYLKNFASFNETFGYRQGEELLRQVARFLHELEGATAYRYSGVSYVVLLPGADPVRSTALAQQVADRFDLPWQIGEVDCLCAVDVGVVLYPDYAETPAQLLHNLDLALTQSAKAGQNQVTLFGPALQERLYRNTVIARLLTTAVQGNNIELRYRPTYSAQAEQYTRVECQARLLTVEFGPVKSSEFGPIAEETGIVCSVNRHVIRRTCELIRLLLAEGSLFESVSVEVSPVLLAQQSFLSDVAALLDEFAIPPKKLAMELFESPLTAHRARPVVDGLRAMGVEIVWSSFDFGYAGFKDLLTLPLDALKLKRLFVWQLETNPRSGPVIEALIRMSRELGIKLIAEGVETDQQNSLLTRYGCPYRQGFYYSPTVGLEELRELLPRLGGV